MNVKPLKELDYDLELSKIVKDVKAQKAKRILLQFPEGLKPHSTQVVEELKKSLPKTEILVWLDTCFGACDIPLEVERLGVDLIVQFGHSPWAFENKKGIKIIK
jgi:2-(3-amino-3-carboxypropyl)histidine synthase